MKTNIIRTRYEKALLKILGYSWRTWWLNQTVIVFKKVYGKNANIKKAHRDILDQKRAEDTTVRGVDYSRNPERSFECYKKYCKYAINHFFLSLFILGYIVIRLYSGRLDLQNYPLLDIGYTCTKIIVPITWVYLTYTISKLSRPNSATQYVSIDWGACRKKLINFGLIRKITDQLYIDKGPNFLEELEYSAEKTEPDPEVSDAIRRAYYEVFKGMTIEFISARKKLIEKNLLGDRVQFSNINSRLGEEFNLAPVFFVYDKKIDFLNKIFSEIEFCLDK